MSQLEFSTITSKTVSSSSLQLRAIEALLDEFKLQHGTQVKLTNFNWEEAWPQLLSIALNGIGPNVSLIGSAFGTTLGAMETLRPFSSKDLSTLGAPDVFWPSRWQSAARTSGERVWAIPWTSHTFLLVYRRDVFAQQGLDEKRAMATPADIIETVQKLQETNLPWVFPRYNFHTDILHLSVSWVWGEGGDLVDPLGRRVLFAEPEAIAGFVNFFEQFRYLGQVSSDDDGTTLFSTGKASMTIIGTPGAVAMLRGDTLAPEVRKNLGFHVLPGVPWVGGDNLVIWKHTLFKSIAEQNALDLVRFLTAPSNQIAYHQRWNTFPARRDVLDQCEFPDSNLTGAVRQALQSGRTDPSIRLWSWIESQLAPVLVRIINQIYEDPKQAIQPLVEANLQPLAKQLNVVLAA